jgi:N-acetylneuraminic acid mutarotase
LSSITVSPGTSTLAVGLTQQLKAMGQFTDGSTTDLTLSAAWTSSAPAVAIVGSAGALAALATGQTVVTAAVGSTRGSAVANVLPASITAIAVTPKPLSTRVGVARQLSATATYTDGSRADVTASASWASALPSVAMVTAGLVSGQAAGRTTVTATAGGFSDSSPVEVVLETWQACANSNFVHYNHTATLLSNGKLLVAGQTGETTVPQSPPEVYDPVTDRWSATASMLDTLRYQSSATLLSSGKVLITGGMNNVRFPNLLATAEIYDPVAGTWSAASSFGTARAWHTTSLLPSGRVLLVGGNSNFGPGLTDVQSYDSEANRWTAVQPMRSGRFYHSATVLANGKLLVVGGFRNTTADQQMTSAELYDPVADSWSSAGDMLHPHGIHTATLLPSGKVLIVGGTLAAGAANAEIYDPASNSWSGAANMSIARSGHAATLLTNGKVLVTGGSASASGTSSEIYDPSSDTWQAALNMPVARTAHTSTLMPGGVVVVVGGRSAGTGCGLY